LEHFRKMIVYYCFNRCLCWNIRKRNQ